TTHPGEVARAGGAAGQDEEAVGGKAGDGEVAAETARLVEHRRVHDAAGRPIDAVRADAFEVAERARSAHLELGERGQVVEGDALARGPVLGTDDRRPVPRRPVDARR